VNRERIVKERKGEHGGERRERGEREMVLESIKIMIALEGNVVTSTSKLEFNSKE